MATVLNCHIKSIDERGVPEILFDAAAMVDQVAPLTGLGAFKREVRGGDHKGERDPGRGRLTQAPGESVQPQLGGICLMVLIP